MDQDAAANAASMKSQSVTVKVPASTSNLGSGFDTLGLAFQLYNFVRVQRSTTKGVRLLSPIPEEERAHAVIMLTEAATLFFRRARQKTFGIEVHLSGEVPSARGLGYSATARLGIIAALNKLTRAGLDRQQLLELVTGLEGHPDNASPAIFGGFTVSGFVGKSVRCLKFSVSSTVQFVTLIPPFKISTEKARALMPQTFSRPDAAHSLNRAALITAAFAGGKYELLRGLFDDRFHQPYREPLIPQLSRVIQAGEKAGAMGGWLSGSGSAIICLAVEKAEAVAKAMQKQLPQAEMKILAADNDGFKLE